MSGNALFIRKKMALITNLRLRDVLTTRHGAKIASIKVGDADLVYQPTDFMRIPFEPSAFADPTSERTNLLNELIEPTHEEFTHLGECLIAYIAEHSERILKKRQSVEQVRANYRSCIRTSEKGYPPTLKSKVDVGMNGVVCWDSDGDQADTPVSWRAFRVKPRYHVTHLWMMGSSFGPVVRLTDALLQADEVVRSNPFK